MRKNTVFIGSCLLINSLLLSSLACAESIQGQVTVKYPTLYGAKLSGAEHVPAYDNDCNQMYGSLVNATINVFYNIDLTTGKQSAYFTYGDANLKLTPMGYSEKYVYSTTHFTPELQALDVSSLYVILDKDFKKTSSFFTFDLKSPEQKFQCILSNSEPPN